MDPYSFLPGVFILIWLAMFVLIIGGFILMIFMLIDAVQVPDDRFYRTGTKLIWILVIVLAGGIGAAIYYYVGRPTPEARAWIKANPQAARPGPTYGYQGPPPYGQAPQGPYSQPPQAPYGGTPQAPYGAPPQAPYNAPQTGAPQPPPEPPAS